jgi:excisionase family DNA binding protein
MNGIVETGPEHLLTVNEAACRLGISQRTVQRMIAAQELPVVRFRHCTRVMVADLLAYQQAHRTERQ